MTGSEQTLRDALERLRGEFAELSDDTGRADEASCAYSNALDMVVVRIDEELAALAAQPATARCVRRIKS